MKKAILGVAAIGAVVGLRPLATRMSAKMREHCGEMAAECKQMGTQFAGQHEPVGRA